MNCGFSAEDVDFRSAAYAKDCRHPHASKTGQRQSERGSLQLPGDHSENPGEPDKFSVLLTSSSKHRRWLRIWKHPRAGLAALLLLAVVLRYAAGNSTQSRKDQTAPITSQQGSEAALSIRTARAAQPVQTVESIADSLAAIEAETDPDQRSEALERTAESISDKDLRAVLHRLVPLEGAGASELRQLLVRRWAETDAPAAAVWVAQLPEGAARHETLQQVAIAWANTDLTAAISWLYGLPDGDSKQAALLNTAYEAARAEPLIAVELARTLLATRERDDLIVHALSQWAATDFAGAADWAVQVADPSLRRQLLAAVAVASAEHDAPGAATFISKALEGGAVQDGAVVAIVNRWAQQSPRDAAQWVAQFPDTPSRHTAEQGVVTLWTAQDASGAATWLNELPPGTLRNVGLAAHAQALARGTEIQLDP
jgi:hypothetical protein